MSDRLDKDCSQEELVHKHLSLVVHIAKNYTNLGLSIEELIQEGNMGLLKAAERYEESKGKFSTYAYYWIKKYILIAVRSCRKQDSRCVTYQDDISSDDDVESTLVNQQTLDKIEDILQGLVRDGEIAQKHVSIFMARIYLQMSLQEIGNDHNLSRERIRQIESNVINQLKRSMIDGL